MSTLEEVQKMWRKRWEEPAKTRAVINGTEQELPPYGCHNGPQISERFAPRCQYDKRKSDPRCVACKWR